jgi:hypothetical protein
MEGRQVTPRALVAPSPGPCGPPWRPPGAMLLAMGDVTPEVKVLKVEGKSRPEAARGTTPSPATCGW